jgi:hypothetical protein
MYVPGEDEYVKAWIGPLEPTSCVSGVEGKVELDMGLIVVIGIPLRLHLGVCLGGQAGLVRKLEGKDKLTG